MNPKISVIIPVFNVEKYIQRCLESVINQSLYEIEIIIIDDGSTDNSGVICDEYAINDHRIKTIHKSNGGLSSARNEGIKIATGKYIGYVDGDDYIDDKLFEKLYDCAELYGVDYVTTDLIRVNKDLIKNKMTRDLLEGFYDKKQIEDIIYPQLIMKNNLEFGPLLSVCGCLFKTEVIKKNKLMFDESIKYSEDVIYSAILGRKVGALYYLDKYSGYYYMENDNTITSSFKTDSWPVYCLMNEKLRNCFKEEIFLMQLDYHLIHFAFDVYIKLGISNLDRKKRIEYLKHVVNTQLLKKAFKNTLMPQVNFKYKLKIILMKYGFVRILDYVR